MAKFELHKAVVHQFKDRGHFVMTRTAIGGAEVEVRHLVAKVATNFCYLGYIYLGL